MTNDEAVKKIVSYLAFNWHFSDYEFGGMNDYNGEKRPRPEKTNWLNSVFRDLMDRLKSFLLTDPSDKQLS